MEAMRQNSVLSNDPKLHTSYAFISCLPTETLQNIFIHCARDYHYQHLCPTKSVPNWVNVSYICRHWRNVALECSTLWAYLFIISRRWTEVLLARSKQASLKIRVGLVPRNIILGLSCVGMVMNHVERIQELSLRLPAPFFQHVVSGLFSRTPRLQVLNIMLEDSSVEWPSLLFNGDPPALRALKLVACPVPLHSFRLSALMILHLVNVPVRFQQSMKEFLATLSRMQDLKHLHLYHALPSATGFLSSAVFKTFGKIDLPHLSRLWICAPLSTAVTLLSCTNIPLETQVRLECNSKPNSSLDHYALLRSLLAQRYKNQALFSLRILSLVICPTEGGAQLTFSPHESGSIRDSGRVLWDKTWDRGIPLQIELDHPMIDKATIINDICSSMPLSNVQSLSVFRPLSSPVFWRQMLQQLQDVRYIKLCGGDMPDLSVLSLMDHTTHDLEGKDVQNHGGLASGDQGQNYILAPRLKKLELEFVKFLPEDDSNQSGPAITCRCLFDALSTRQGPPGHLVIFHCDTPGSGTFNMAGVWGNDGFHIVSKFVHPPEVESKDWMYDDSDDEEEEEEEEEEEGEEEEEESVHFPVADL